MTASSQPETPWLTAAEAARYGRVAVRTLYAAVDRGQIRVARIASGRCLRFHRSWIDSWLETSAAPIDVPEDRR